VGNLGEDLDGPCPDAALNGLHRKRLSLCTVQHRYAQVGKGIPRMLRVIPCSLERTEPNTDPITPTSGPAITSSCRWIVRSYTVFMTSAALSDRDRDRDHDHDRPEVKPQPCWERNIDCHRHTRLHTRASMRQVHCAY